MCTTHAAKTGLWRQNSYIAFTWRVNLALRASTPTKTVCLATIEKCVWVSKSLETVVTHKHFFFYMLTMFLYNRNYIVSGVVTVIEISVIRDYNTRVDMLGVTFFESTHYFLTIPCPKYVLTILYNSLVCDSQHGLCIDV